MMIYSPVSAHLSSSRVFAHNCVPGVGRDAAARRGRWWRTEADRETDIADFKLSNGQEESREKEKWRLSTPSYVWVSALVCVDMRVCVVLGDPTPPPEPSPQPTVKNPEEIKRKAEWTRIKLEFTAALKREGTLWAIGWHCLVVPVVLLYITVYINSTELQDVCVFMRCVNSKNVLCLCAEHAVKLRLDLVKAHALRNVSSLQQRAEQVYRNMEEWLGARFLSEMNRWEEEN